MNDEQLLDKLEDNLWSLNFHEQLRALRRLRKNFSRELAAVAAFMDANGQPRLRAPGIPPPETIKLADFLVREEVVKELLNEALPKAHSAVLRHDDDKQAVVEVADGIVDSIYVLLWTAHAFGLGERLERVWRAVEAKNASKAGAPKDQVTGKVMRPEGYEPPDIWNAVYGEED